MKLSKALARQLGLELPTASKRGQLTAPTLDYLAFVAMYCRSQGYAQPVAEHHFDSVCRWRFDLAWPEHHLAVEVEGVTPGGGGRHQRIKGYEADCEKYNAAVLQGWRIVRLTPRMLKAGYLWPVLDYFFRGTS